MKTYQTANFQLHCSPTPLIADWSKELLVLLASNQRRDDTGSLPPRLDLLHSCWFLCTFFAVKHAETLRACSFFAFNCCWWYRSLGFFLLLVLCGRKKDLFTKKKKKFTRAIHPTKTSTAGKTDWLDDFTVANDGHSNHRDRFYRCFGQICPAASARQSADQGTSPDDRAFSEELARRREVARVAFSARALAVKRRGDWTTAVNEGRFRHQIGHSACTTRTMLNKSIVLSQ